MSENAASQGKSTPLAEASLGTQVIYKWADWQNQQAGKPIRTASFRKESRCLVVHQYGDALCGVLQLADVKPMVRDFREWKEPFHTVQGKLIKRGWSLVSDSGEVRHVAH